MRKVYVINYVETYSDGSFLAGVSYVMPTLYDAQKMLKSIKEDEKQFYLDAGTRETMEEINELFHDIEQGNGFKIDFGDEYTMYTIREYEVKKYNDIIRGN